MEEETKLIPQTIQVIIQADGKSAISDSFGDSGKKYKIQEIILGAGPMRKSIPWTQGFLKECTECDAEILENGRLRILNSR